MNGIGEVVGHNTAGHAFLYSNGVMTDLGTLGGSYSLALNINDAGQVVGWSWNADDTTTQGFLYSNGMMGGLSPTAVTGSTRD